MNQVTREYLTVISSGILYARNNGKKQQSMIKQL